MREKIYSLDDLVKENYSFNFSLDLSGIQRENFFGRAKGTFPYISFPSLNNLEKELTSSRFQFDESYVGFIALDSLEKPSLEFLHKSQFDSVCDTLLVKDEFYNILPEYLVEGEIKKNLIPTKFYSKLIPYSLLLTAKNNHARILLTNYSTKKLDEKEREFYERGINIRIALKEKDHLAWDLDSISKAILKVYDPKGIYKKVVLNNPLD